MVGMRVCSRGSTTSAEACGYITDVVSPIQYGVLDDGLTHLVHNAFTWDIDGNATNIPGDSGGPVYAVNPDGSAVAVAVGIISGYAPPYSLATKVSSAMAYTGTTLASTLGRPPFGHLDLAVASGNTLRLTGWAFDPDNAQQSISLHVYVGGPAGSGAPGYVRLANGSRPDVAAAYPGAGAAHGFDTTVPIPTTGSFQVYVYLMDQGTTYVGNPLFSVIGVGHSS